MTDELPALETADEDERRCAAALARALDGGPAEPGMPELEAAALLRLSSGGGQLNPARRGEIRRALLAELPRAPARARWALPRWLVLALPLAGAAAAAVLLLVRTPELELAPRDAAAPIAASQTQSKGTPSEPAWEAEPALEGARAARTFAEAPASALKRGATEGEPSLASRAGDPVTRQSITGLDRDARVLRSALLARVGSPSLARVHAERDAAMGPAALEQSQRALASALSTLTGDLGDTDARLVRQDLYCRLAQTALELGQAQAALEWTRRGLDLNGPPTAFLAQLSALEGDALAELGDDEGAARSYLKALRVHETLLQDSLDGR
jgi:tetratricopeptide (TPR) repeat protein